MLKESKKHEKMSACRAFETVDIQGFLNALPRVVMIFDLYPQKRLLLADKIKIFNI